MKKNKIVKAKSLRTVAEIDAEYSNACGELGQEVHNQENEMKQSMERAIDISQKKVIALKSKITALKAEATVIRAAEAEKLAKEMKKAPLAVVPDAK